MELRQMLKLSVEFEAMAEMISRLRALDRGDDKVLCAQLKIIEDSLTATRLYMEETASLQREGERRLRREYPNLPPRRVPL